MTYFTDDHYKEYLEKFTIDECRDLNEFYQELQLIIAHAENYSAMLHEINDATIIRYDSCGYGDSGMNMKYCSSYAFTLISEKPYTKAEASAIVGKLSAGLVERIAGEIKLNVDPEDPPLLG